MDDSLLSPSSPRSSSSSSSSPLPVPPSPPPPTRQKSATKGRNTQAKAPPNLGRNCQDSPVIRLNPTQYAHVLDKNLNVTRLISGPLTYVRHDHETLVHGPEEMVLCPPRFYVKVKNPALIKDGQPTLDSNQQIVLAHGEEEIRLCGPPFPLYPGEEVLEISPLRVVSAHHALRLEAARDFTDDLPDGTKIKRVAGDVWQFVGPATYVPRVEVNILGEVFATAVAAGSALRLAAKQHLIDCDGVERQAGEEWLMRREGAYLPGVHELIAAEIAPIVLTLKTAIHLRALRTFTDDSGAQRLAGEEWVLTRANCASYVLGVDEEVLNSALPLTVLARNEYCVVLNAWRDGKPVSGRKELRRGERTFFLQPGEELEGGVQAVVVLVEDEALLLRATEPFTDVSGVLRTPGDRWNVVGPCEYVPPVEVEVVKRYKSIPLDENEGVYIRNVKTGRVEMIVGRAYLLKADEELWEKELDPTVEKLLQTSRGYANTTKLKEMQMEQRDKTRVVTYRTPHNTAVQVYDFRLKKSRIVWGPGLVMLGPDEEFTLVSLSGNTPKKPQVLKTICLKLGPDFMSDIVVVETSDHARLSIRLSYNWTFDVTSSDDKCCLFNVPDFVGDCCMALASRVRGMVASKTFDDLHRNSSEIIQQAIFGRAESGELRSTREFKDNHLIVTGVDIQSVEPVDAKTRDALLFSVQQAIQITTQAQEANARHVAERDEQEAKGRLQRERLRDEVEAEKAKQGLFQLQAESSALLSMGKAKAEARARAEASQIEMEAKLKQAQLQIRAKQIKDQWDLQRQKEGQELEIRYQGAVNEIQVGLARDLAQIEIDRFRGQVDAIGKDTIKAMARAGPETHAKLLGGLGLESVLITNGTSPINLFRTAHGLIGHGAGAS